MNVQLGGLRYGSFDEGPGPRTVLWLAGCSIRCPGCVNSHLWPESSGQSVSIAEAGQQLLAGLERGDRGVSFVGGEPFDQAAALCALVNNHWARSPSVARLIIYSGYTYEQLCARPAARAALSVADVLVDGPFIASQADVWAAARGHAQRPLHIGARAINA